MKNRTNTDWSPKLVNICLNCDNKINFYRPKNKNYVCSDKCADEFQKQCEADIKQLQDEELQLSESIRCEGLRK
jgi:hypothetical protein